MSQWIRSSTLRARKSIPASLSERLAADINAVQAILNAYVESEHLKTKKILIVHQFGDAAVHDGVPFTIQKKKTLKSYPNVELVIDADGLGSPAVKNWKYNAMTDTRMYPALGFRGIKIFS